MSQKVVFDKTFVKFKISNTFKQNIDATRLKQPKIHRKIHSSLWILKISRKKIHELTVSRLLRNVCDFKKENHTLGYGLKIVLFFVISISGLH